MFKIIVAAASGEAQSQSSRLIADPEALDLTDTPTYGVAQGQTGLNPQGHLTGSSQSLEFDGIDDYIKLATVNGFGTEILTEEIGKADIKHGSTANNIAMETWIKIDSSSTAIDKNSEFFEMTIQRNSASSTTGFDGIYVCRTIFAPSAFNSDITTRPAQVGGITLSAHYLEIMYAGERVGETVETEGATVSAGDVFAYSMTSACDVPLNTWTHVWCEHTVTGNSITPGHTANTNGHWFRIWINGVLNRQQTDMNCMNKLNARPTDPFPTSGSPVSNFYNRAVSFDGKLDEMRLWLQSGTHNSITNVGAKGNIGLVPNQFPDDSTVDPATANSASIQFSPSAEYLAAWWRFENLSAVDLFANVADSIPDATDYSHSATPANFQGSVDFSEESTNTLGPQFNNFWKMDGGTIQHGGLMAVTDTAGGAILIDEGMENLVTSANCTWSASASNTSSVEIDDRNIFYGASATVVNTTRAGGGAVHTINYSNLLFDRNDYTLSFRGLLTSGSPSARVIFTVGSKGASASTTAVFGRTTWKPIVLTRTASAEAAETSMTGSVEIQQLSNVSSDDGSYFRLDGLAIQEGGYYSTYIGPEQVRKSGQIAWRTND